MIVLCVSHVSHCLVRGFCSIETSISFGDFPHPGHHLELGSVTSGDRSLVTAHQRGVGDPGKKKRNWKLLGGTGTMEFYDFPFSCEKIIPTDELIFFRGVGIPPTRWYHKISIDMSYPKNWASPMTSLHFAGSHMWSQRSVAERQVTAELLWYLADFDFRRIQGTGAACAACAAWHQPRYSTIHGNSSVLSETTHMFQSLPQSFFQLSLILMNIIWPYLRCSIYQNQNTLWIAKVGVNDFQAV